VTTAEVLNTDGAGELCVVETPQHPCSAPIPPTREPNSSQTVRVDRTPVPKRKEVLDRRACRRRIVVIDEHHTVVGRSKSVDRRDTGG
jgi:hypothetical protein